MPKAARVGKPARSSELVMDENAAAAKLILSPRTLQRWRVEGRGPRYVKLGKRIVYTLSALEAFVRGGERQSTSEPAA